MCQEHINQPRFTVHHQHEDAEKVVPSGHKQANVRSEFKSFKTVCYVFWEK